MLFKISTLLALTIAGGIALSVAADKGYPNAIVLRQQIKDVSGFDLAMLTDTKGGDPHIDFRQRIIDKIKELKADAQTGGSKSADNGGASALLQKTATYSSQAVSASNFLERNLTTDAFLFSGKFMHVDDDICHIKAVENLLFGRLTLDFFMADIDVNSLKMKSTSSTDWLNVDTVKDRYFKFARYNDEAKRWGKWELNPSAAFVAPPSNQQNIMKAMDVLAVECGAPEGF